MANPKASKSGEKAPHVCPWQSVKSFDNFLRPLIHNPVKMFRPYVQEGMQVLDVGCGRGFASIGLAKLVGQSGKVTSADLQPEMLAMVKERAEKSGLLERIDFHRCESDRIGASGPVDFAVAFWMAHETPDQAAFFNEIGSLLKPGGHFFLAEPKGHVSNAAFDREIQLAKGAGLDITDRPKVRFSRAVVLRKVG